MSIPLSHLLFELGSYGLFIAIFFHAWRSERWRELLAILLTGTVYGVLLETITIYQLQSYVYGQFIVMFNHQVPLVIGVGWGIILYSAMAIADRFRLSFPAWVMAVGLIGLAIDATMDVAAVRVGMWNWNSFMGSGPFMAANQEWFGVPFGNYYAWFIVLTSAAAFLRWLKPGQTAGIWSFIWRCLVTIVASLTCLVGLDGLYVQIAPAQWWPVALELTVAAVLIILSRLRKSGTVRNAVLVRGWPVRLVPAFFHLYFGAILIWAWFDPQIIERAELKSAYPAQMPVLLVMAAIYMLVTAVLLWLALRPLKSGSVPINAVGSVPNEAFTQRYGPWAVVAGASEGLGAAFAQALASRGCKLVLVARRPDILESLAAKLRQNYGAEVVCLAADLSIPDCIEQIKKATAGHEVGLAVYNAAFAPMGYLTETDPDDLAKIVGVNIQSPLQFARALLPDMAARGRGGLILMSSMAGAQGSPRLAGYAASKAFNRVLAESLWHEMKGQGVDVLACVAGAIRTPGYLQSSNGDAPGTLDPAQVAEAAIAALGRGPLVIPGTINRIASFVLGRCLPRRLSIAIMAKNTTGLEQPTKKRNKA